MSSTPGLKRLFRNDIHLINHKILSWLVGMLLALGLSACSPLVGGGQPAVGSLLTLSAGQTLGQTFTCRQDGLSGLRVYLAPASSPEDPAASEIRLDLKAQPGAGTDITSAALSLKEVQNPGFYTFQFPAPLHSQGLYYYFELELSGPGTVQVSSAPGSSYLDGALYANGTPQDAQMSFLTVYDRVQALVGLAYQGLTWGEVLLVGIFLFVLPGWALLSWLLPGWEGLSWPEKLGLAGGLSLAAYPLLMLWTHLVHLQLGWGYAFLPPLAALAALAWKVLRSGQPLSQRLKGVNFRLVWADLAFIGLLGLLVFTRFWPVHDLEAPLWGDSYQHTLMAQLIVDNGGLFSSWRPYTELSTFTYHFGFHAAAAAFHWTSGLSVVKSVLWTGQLLNLLAVLALYPLAVKIGKSRWAGVAAMLVAGLISPMPNFYINWGRYTQLAGQAILPAALLLAWAYLEGKGKDWRLRGLIWIAWGGLALTHYRVIILAALFFPAYFLLRLRRDNWKDLVVKTLWAGLGALLACLPWLVRSFGGKLLSIVTRQLSTPLNSLAGPAELTNPVGSWLTYLPAAVWLLLLLATAWSLWKRSREAALLATWWLLVFLAGNPQLIHLQGSGVITGFAVMIASYIPAGLLIGGTIGLLAGELEAGHAHWGFAQKTWAAPLAGLVALGLVLGIGAWDARGRMNDAQVGTYSLVTRPDVRAFEWIKQNTPAEAVFLVNSFLAYNGSSAVGSDAGWWLPVLAGRRSTLPPLTYSSEQGYDPALASHVKALSQAVTQLGAADPQALSLFKLRGVDYVYIGQQQGRVNNLGSVIDPAALQKSPHFQPVYHQDRVWVFKVLP